MGSIFLDTVSCCNPATLQHLYQELEDAAGALQQVTSLEHDISMFADTDPEDHIFENLVRDGRAAVKHRSLLH